MTAAQAQTALPSCTLAEITAAITTGTSAACSTAGAVVYGTDPTAWVVSQCGTFAVPNQDPATTEKNKKACITCAKDQSVAFFSAAKARLITVSTKKLGLSAIKKLCGQTDTGDSNSGSPDAPKLPEKSEPLKQLFEQVRQCLPSDRSQATDAAQCVTCVTGAFDAAKTASVINPAQYSAYLANATRICTEDRGKKNPAEGTPPAGKPSDGKPGDDSGEQPGPPVGTPTPVAKPPAGDNSAYRLFTEGLVSCVTKFKFTGDAAIVDQCKQCVKGVSVPTSGVDPKQITAALTYVNARCEGKSGV